MKVELHTPNADPIVGTYDDPFMSMAEVLLAGPPHVDTIEGARLVLDQQSWEKAMADPHSKVSLLPDPKLRGNTAKMWRDIPIEVR